MGRLSLSWLNSDGRSLLVTRLLRTFGYGYLAVILGLYLEQRGLRASEVGLILTAAVSGSAAMNILCRCWPPGSPPNRGDDVPADDGGRSAVRVQGESGTAPPGSRYGDDQCDQLRGRSEPVAEAWLDLEPGGLGTPVEARTVAVLRGGRNPRQRGTSWTSCCRRRCRACSLGCTGRRRSMPVRSMVGCARFQRSDASKRRSASSRSCSTVRCKCLLGTGSQRARQRDRVDPCVDVDI
jgi:hypothetical protein